MAEKKWYVLRVISGKERKLQGYIEAEIKRLGWENSVSQILVPTEKVYQIKAGKKVIKEKNFFPGYIMIEAEEGGINGDVISMMRGFTGVIGFLGRNNPIPLRQSEANRILGKVDEMQDAGASMNEPFIVNETVKIIDGPFNDFNGTIEEIYDDKKKLKVIVKIFGRRTPVELNFMQVEKTS
ncbi:UNVERIFIED_CONTAM: hypothetical protein GTU68_020186 [Idotea baltica]|nr:hypothetical protein [Idotea baltica]